MNKDIEIKKLKAVIKVLGQSKDNTMKEFGDITDKKGRPDLGTLNSFCTQNNIAVTVALEMIIKLIETIEF